METSQKLRDRLLSKMKVSAQTGCWDWTAAKGHNGYGKLKIGGRSGGCQRAHRVSYEVHCGPIGEGLYVCHRCDNRACINPDHLFLGSHADNMSDRDKKGRQADRRGVKHGNAKLSDADVLAIRAADGFTQKELAEQYGVHQTQISNILRGVQWAHVDISDRPVLV